MFSRDVHSTGCQDESITGSFSLQPEYLCVVFTQMLRVAEVISSVG